MRRFPQPGLRPEPRDFEPRRSRRTRRRRGLPLAGTVPTSVKPHVLSTRCLWFCLRGLCALRGSKLPSPIDPREHAAVRGGDRPVRETLGALGVFARNIILSVIRTYVVLSELSGNAFQLWRVSSADFRGPKSRFNKGHLQPASRKVLSPKHLCVCGACQGPSLSLCPAVTQRRHDENHQKA